MKPKEAEWGEGQWSKGGNPQGHEPRAIGPKKRPARAMVSDGVVVATMRARRSSGPCADGADTLGATGLQASVE
jgi:hypothetical protein